MLRVCYCAGTYLGCTGMARWIWALLAAQICYNNLRDSCIPYMHRHVSRRQLKMASAGFLIPSEGESEV